jgi:hypothetical protein
MTDMISLDEARALLRFCESDWLHWLASKNDVQLLEIHEFARLNVLGTDKILVIDAQRPNDERLFAADQNVVEGTAQTIGLSPEASTPLYTMAMCRSPDVVPVLYTSLQRAGTTGLLVRKTRTMALPILHAQALRRFADITDIDYSVFMNPKLLALIPDGCTNILNMVLGLEKDHGGISTDQKAPSKLAEASNNLIRQLIAKGKTKTEDDKTVRSNPPTVTTPASDSAASKTDVKDANAKTKTKDDKTVGSNPPTVTTPPPPSDSDARKDAKTQTNTKESESVVSFADVPEKDAYDLAALLMTGETIRQVWSSIIETQEKMYIIQEMMGGTAFNAITDAIKLKLVKEVRANKLDDGKKKDGGATSSKEK